MTEAEICSLPVRDLMGSRGLVLVVHVGTPRPSSTRFTRGRTYVAMPSLFGARYQTPGNLEGCLDIIH